MTDEVVDRRVADLKTGSLRTVTPLVVGLVISQAAKYGLKVDDATASTLIGLSSSFAYYLGARVLELWKNSRWGKLLGSAKVPVYTETPAIITDKSGTSVVPEPELNDPKPEQTDNSPRDVDGEQEVSQDPDVAYVDDVSYDKEA